MALLSPVHRVGTTARDHVAFVGVAASRVAGGGVVASSKAFDEKAAERWDGGCDDGDILLDSAVYVRIDQWVPVNRV